MGYYIIGSCNLIRHTSVTVTDHEARSMQAENGSEPFATIFLDLILGGKRFQGLPNPTLRYSLITFRLDPNPS